MKLQANVGNADLIARVALGLVLVMLLAVGAIGPWGLVGIVLILTGVARWCPLYALMKVDTLRHRPHHGDA